MLACKTFMVKHRFCVLQLYITLKDSLNRFWKTSFSLGLLDLSQALTTGFQFSPEELIYTCKNDKYVNHVQEILSYCIQEHGGNCLALTIPFLDTVAGEALSMLWGSKIILQVGAMESLSPLARVKVLLSSSTEFRFSIQILSTGPSNTSQTCSPTTKHKILFNLI